MEGSDLYIGPDGHVWARAMGGDFQVDLIYRRVEDLELFVPGLTEAYLNHKVALVNALGTGAGDDKLVFLWVQDMIRQYLGEVRSSSRRLATTCDLPKTGSTSCKTWRVSF